MKYTTIVKHEAFAEDCSSTRLLGDWISAAFDRLLTELEQVSPNLRTGAREMALVRTKLEEAYFFARRAERAVNGFTAAQQSDP